MSSETSVRASPSNSAAPRVGRGRLVPANADISVVVMAINGDERVAGAVASLLAEKAPAEIIVVNTGSGSVKAALGEMADQVVLVEADALHLPGGTRNLGIGQSTAGIVAFLAADCRAAPGWIAGRLAAHRAGARAVATALRPLPDGSGSIPSTSWATYALLHARRAPEWPARSAALYGASYDRGLFERHGLFREDVRVGEDTEFNERVATEAPLVWAPEVVTLHAYPTSAGTALADAFDRGWQLYGWNRGHHPRPLRATVRRALGNWRVARLFAGLTSGDIRKALWRAAPLTALLAAAYACGALAAACRPSRQ